MKPDVVIGNILDQNVEVIVNSWNRNIIPWWLLLPQGVSGAIKKKAGNRPFIEVARYGSIPLAGEVDFCRAFAIQGHHSRCRHKSVFGLRLHTLYRMPWSVR